MIHPLPPVPRAPNQTGPPRPYFGRVAPSTTPSLGLASFAFFLFIGYLSTNSEEEREKLAQIMVLKHGHL